MRPFRAPYALAGRLGGTVMGSLSSIENVAKSGRDDVKHAPGDVEHPSESAWNDAVAEAKKAGRQLSDPNSLMSQLGHTALDTVGMVPIVGSVAEGVNAGWYAAQGDYADAALSAAAAIPVAGDAADAARLTRDGIGLARDGETVAEGVRDAATISEDARAIEAARPRGADVPHATLHGESYEIPGWHNETISYSKRAPEDAHALRATFDARVHKAFLRHLGAEQPEVLREAGMTDAQIARVASGRVPQGYQVHHILPLDDGGTNSFDNLVLIRNNPDHMLITNHQNLVTKGLEPGQTRVVSWPVPDEPTGVWPDAPGHGPVPIPTEP
jgi:hypothetical protein